MRNILAVRVRFTPLVFVAFLAACAHEPAPSAPGHRPVGLNEEFTLTVGDSARVSETGMLIRFDSVLEDSRCPAAVNCIWEGNARVKIYVLAPTGGPGAKPDLSAVPVELNTSGRFERRRAIDPGFIELRALSPQPPIRDPKVYAATLFIEVSQ